MTTRPLVVCDFDGTLTTFDVGRALYERFADPAWLDVEARWKRGELSMIASQIELVSLLRAQPDELVAHALAVGRFRAGADELFAAAAAGRIELVVASSGFDLYIAPLLASASAGELSLHCNALAWDGDGHRLTFPHPHLACDDHSICKARVMDRALREHRRVVFCGDGLGDRCAAAVATDVYAVAGSDLSAWCERAAVAYRAFESFGSVLADLRGARSSAST